MSEHEEAMSRWYQPRQGWHHIGCDGRHPPFLPCLGTIAELLTVAQRIELDNTGRMDVVDQMLLDLEGEREQRPGRLERSPYGRCRGCRTEDVRIDGYQLCSYCRELAGLVQQREALAAQEPEPEQQWPWPLSVRSFLVRFWLVLALIAAGLAVGWQLGISAGVR